MAGPGLQIDEDKGGEMEGRVEKGKRVCYDSQIPWFRAMRVVYESHKRTRARKKKMRMERRQREKGSLDDDDEASSEETW